MGRRTTRLGSVTGNLRSSVDGQLLWLKTWTGHGVWTGRQNQSRLSLPLSYGASSRLWLEPSDLGHAMDPIEEPLSSNLQQRSAESLVPKKSRASRLAPDARPICPGWTDEEARDEEPRVGDEEPKDGDKEPKAGDEKSTGLSVLQYTCVPIAAVVRHMGLPCIGGCGFEACGKNWSVSDQLQGGLDEANLQLFLYCCGSCALRHLKVRGWFDRPPASAHGPRCERLPAVGRLA